jgi:hypothetical protein
LLEFFAFFAEVFCSLRVGESVRLVWLFHGNGARVVHCATGGYGALSLFFHHNNNKKKGKSFIHGEKGDRER